MAFSCRGLQWPGPILKRLVGRRLFRIVSFLSIRFHQGLKETFGLIESLIWIIRHQKNMPHFASWHGLRFSVEVKPDLRMSEETVPPGRSVLP